MALKNYLLPAGVLALIIFVARKLYFAQNLFFTIGKVDFSGNILNPTLNIELIANNITNVSATVYSIEGKIYANDTTYIGTILSNKIVTIEGYKKTVIPVTVNLGFGGILNTVSYFLKNSNYKITIVGSAVVDKLTVPINTTFSN